MSQTDRSLADGGLTVGMNGTTAVITLNRPATRNAMTAAMWTAMPGLMTELAADKGVKAILLTGTGGHFCAGADISEFPAAFANEAAARAFNGLVEAGRAALTRQPKPTIAVVQGLAVGGGCGLAVACDLRFAAAGARFAMPPARLGSAYRFTGVRQLVDLIGPARTKDMLYSARTIGADEALRIGLIDRILPDDDLLQEALDYCEGMAALASTSHHITKQMVQAVLDGADDETGALRAMFDDSFTSRDFLEGYQAFLEKRKPVFE